MNITRTPISTVGTAAKSRIGKHVKRTVFFLLVASALALVGCGRQVPSFWPDLAVEASGGTAAQGTVYMASGQLFALQADNGNAIWAYPTVQQRGGGILGGCTAQAPSDGPFYSAPAFSGEYLFLGSSGQQQRSLFSRGENLAGLRVLNNQGQLQWSFKGTTQPTVTSPALAGSTVYLPSSDHNVYAIDIDTQQVRWVFQTKNWVWATPLVAEGSVYVASMDHVLYAVQGENGAEIWRFDGSQTALPTAPALADGTLYIGSLGGRMYAVEAQTGTLVWEHAVDGGIWGTPLIQNGLLYFGTLNSKVYALNVADGQEVWSQSVGGEVRGSPAHIDGTVYFGCQDGRLYLFDAQSGSQITTLLGQEIQQGSIYTSPVFDGHYLYVVTTTGQVFALDPATNAIVWQANPLRNQN